MVMKYDFNLYRLFGGTEKDLMFTINSREPQNLTYKRIFFFFFLLLFGFLLASRYQKEKQRLRPKLGIFCVQVCCGEKIKQRIEIVMSLASPSIGLT